MWALRGVQVDPAAVEAVRQANAMRPRERRTLDFGWSPAGGLWMATRLAFPVSGSQRGADEGDVLLIEYDLISNRATLRLADDYVLEEMSPVT